MSKEGVHPMKPIQIVAATLLLAFAGILPAQSIDALLDNTNKTQVIVALDRTVYFPGEAAAITFAVKNPTSNSLTVLEPFRGLTGCLDMLTLSGGIGPSLMGAESLCTGSVDSSTPTTVLAAGEQRLRTLKSYDPTFESELQLMPIGGGVPRDAGYYTVEYTYPGSGSRIAAYQVVAPHLEASAVARVADITYDDPALEQTVSTPGYMEAFALRWMNESYVCVTLEPTSVTSGRRADEQGNFNGQSLPYVRVASSLNPIASITLTADASGNLTLEFRDSTGRVTGIPLGSAPPAPAPKSVSVGMSPPWAGLGAAQDLQFTALTTSGTNDVIWDVSLDQNAPARSDPGTVSSSGLYLAPTHVTAAYNVIVTAQSRENPRSQAIGVVNLGTQETVSRPAIPSGPSSASVGNAQQYTTIGAPSSLGHPVQYAFDWGDGSSSGWFQPGLTTASHSWSAAGTYTVMVRARCAAETGVRSDASPGLQVIIEPPPLL